MEKQNEKLEVKDGDNKEMCNEDEHEKKQNEAEKTMVNVLNIHPFKIYIIFLSIFIEKEAKAESAALETADAIDTRSEWDVLAKGKLPPLHEAAWDNQEVFQGDYREHLIPRGKKYPPKFDQLAPGLEVFKF